MSAARPLLVVSGYASIDYALQLAPFEGFDATTIVRARAEEWPRYGGVAHVTRAASLADAGVDVAALSWVGSDAEGHRWIDAVASSGADTVGVAVSAGRSPSSHLLYPEGAGTICLFDPGDAGTDRLTDAQRTLLGAADVAVVTIGPECATRELLAAVRPDCRLFWILKQDPSSLTDALLSELSARAWAITLSDGERGALDRILPLAAPGTLVVVTRGSRGSELLRISADRSLESLGEVPSSPVSGVDTTGAGDTFSGTLAALLAGETGTAPSPQRVLADLERASLATARMLAERRSAPEPRNTPEKKRTR
ncbi:MULTISPECIES: carbohydrate kinase family protein [unclassified Leucobacter]|uniref:carbohydrate kinase family protein n=1 Tax=unclassified Leucobacter TaxID=2621730 RepID=UPI00069C49B1|nr:carbohydrate kinase family protein [Leucobacter sp. Ag1]